jgi:hypothetical protein
VLFFSEGACKDMQNVLKVQPELQQAQLCLRRCQGFGAGKPNREGQKRNSKRGNAVRRGDDAEKELGGVVGRARSKEGDGKSSRVAKGAKAGGKSRSNRALRRKELDEDAALREELWDKFGKDFRAAGKAGQVYQVSFGRLQNRVESNRAWGGGAV